MASVLHFHVPFSWYHRTQKVQFALDHGHGVEVCVFAGGDAVDDPYARSEYERRVTKKLRRFPNSVSMHGAFMDLVVHSGDSLIAYHSRQRILEDVRLAGRLGCQKAVFHTGYNPLIPSEKYRDRFYAAQAEFWQQASLIQPGVLLCLENQWETDPAIMLELMRRIDRPNVRVCLDVGHAHAYSQVPAVTWLDRLASYVAHMHWNDNLGDTDSHMPIGKGSLDWAAIARRTRQLQGPVSIVIELNSLRSIEHSLAHLAALPGNPLPEAALRLLPAKESNP